MSTSVPRYVVIDDTDSNIHYTGPWITNNGSNFNNQGNFGNPYSGSLHGASGVASFSYSFTGTSINILGTVAQVNSSTGIVDPQWQCLVDNVAITVADPFLFLENNWVLCHSGQLSDGPHVLTVSAASQGHMFWFDQLQYAVGPSTNLSTADFLIDHADPGIIYDSGWENIDPGNLTGKTGSTAKLSFIGTAFSWYGTIHTELPHPPTTATYSIDGGASILFTLSGLPSGNSITQYNQLFFTTPNLTRALHNLTVTYQGTNATTPLSLVYLIVSNSTTATSLPVESTPNNSGKSHGPPTGAIVGGVVGGIALLLAITGVIFFYRRRKSSNTKTNMQAFYSPTTPTAQLSDIPFTHPISYPHDPYAEGSPRPMPLSNYSQSAATSSAALTYAPPPSSGATQPLFATGEQHPKLQKQLDAISAYTDRSSRAVLHQLEDSGIRLPEANPSIVEVPPSYTPS